MSNNVRAGIVAHDTGAPLSDLLNTIAAEFGISAVELLGGAVIAEGVWREHADRQHPWPDVSFGFGQAAVKWVNWREIALTAPWVTASDGTLADTPGNRAAVRDFMWDAERALRYVAPRYARLRAMWGSALEAWCRWNKPAIPGKDNPNRPNYVRSLAEAEQYREQEEPMPDFSVGPGIKAAMQQYADEPRGDETPLGADYQAAPGRDRLYVYSKASNQVYQFPKA